MPGLPVVSIRKQCESCLVWRGNGAETSGRCIVLVAGSGKRFPARLQRGQILVTQRTRRFLGLPIAIIRQTEENTVMIGGSKEDAGFNTGTNMHTSQAMAARAALAFPHLADVSVVRTRRVLRVMSPGGFPIYQTWADMPGIFALGCHSIAILAAIHAEVLASVISKGFLPDETVVF